MVSTSGADSDCCQHFIAIVKIVGINGGGAACSGYLMYIPVVVSIFEAKHDCHQQVLASGGGLGSRPKKMYGERLGDGVEYHLMSPTPRR